MPARLVWVAVAWFTALGGLAAAFYGSGSARLVRPVATTALARSINESQPASRSRWRWTTTSATSALREMVVHVEAVDVNEARRIAEQIVEPRRDRYDEVLVYVHRLGGSARLAPRRVEWSRRDGYVEMKYAGQ